MSGTATCSCGALAGVFTETRPGISGIYETILYTTEREANLIGSNVEIHVKIQVEMETTSH